MEPICWPTLSSVGASLIPPCFRFHTPLIEPDVRIYRIRLSEKTHAIAAAIPCDAACDSKKNSSGVIRLIANLPSFVASCVRLQLRPLPSTGVTRLRRYYEPLRHPSRPGPSLTSCQLIVCAITAGTSRVVDGPLCLHAVANTPAGLMETCSLVRSHQLRPSPKPGRVGSCITRFEACSAFTRVTACMLAWSPLRPSAPEASAVSLPLSLL